MRETQILFTLSNLFGEEVEFILVGKTLRLDRALFESAPGTFFGVLYDLVCHLEQIEK